MNRNVDVSSIEKKNANSLFSAVTVIWSPQRYCLVFLNGGSFPTCGRQNNPYHPQSPCILISGNIKCVCWSSSSTQDPCSV